MAELGLVVVLWHAVGGDELIYAAVPDPVGRISTEHSVGDKSMHLSRTLLLQ